MLKAAEPYTRLAPTRPYSPPFPAEILQANDSLTQAINLYKQLVQGEEVNGEAAAAIPGEQRAGRLGHHLGSASNSQCRPGIRGIRCPKLAGETTKMFLGYRGAVEGPISWSQGPMGQV